MPFNLGFTKQKQQSESQASFEQQAKKTGLETGTQSTQATTEQQQKQLETAVQNILNQTQQTQTQTGSQKGTTSVSGGTTQKTDQAQQALTTMFGKDTQAALETTVNNLLASMGIQQQTSTDLTGLLASRAKTAGTDIAAQNLQTIEAARFSGEKSLQALQTQLAQQAGGSIANTGVVSATAEGRAQLESGLAGLTAQLNQQARMTQTEELLKSLSGIQGVDAIVAPLLNALKGATTEQVGTVTGAQQATQQSTQLQDIESIAKVIADTVAQTTGKTETTSVANLLSQATTEQQSMLQSLIDEITKGTQSSKTKGSATGFSAGYTSPKPAA